MSKLPSEHIFTSLDMPNSYQGTDLLLCCSHMGQTCFLMTWLHYKASYIDRVGKFLLEVNINVLLLELMLVDITKRLTFTWNG